MTTVTNTYFSSIKCMGSRHLVAKVCDGSVETPAKPDPRGNEPNTDYENLQFFFHSDHLGSTSYMTDLSGEVSQHVEYFPYGGLIVEERSSGTENPYLFNGKELDLETGLYYYGARYYDRNHWLSVDPLAEQYPNISTYTYCAGNPIGYRDENGEWLNFVVGAVVGAATDYGLQVAINLAEGKGLGDALTDVDGKSIGTSAVLGATGVGILSKVKKIVKNRDKIVKVITRTTRAKGKGVKIIKQSGKTKDITKTRVKKFDPAPRNPSSKPNQVNYKKAPSRVPKDSKVLKTDPKKRTPTKNELKVLRKAKDIE